MIALAKQLVSSAPRRQAPTRFPLRAVPLPDAPVLSLDPLSVELHPESCAAALWVTGLAAAAPRLLPADILAEVARRELQLRGPNLEALATDRRLAGRSDAAQPLGLARELLTQPAGAWLAAAQSPLTALLASVSAACLTPLSVHAVPGAGSSLSLDARGPAAAVEPPALAPDDPASTESDGTLLVSTGLDATQRLAATEALLRVRDHLLDAGAEAGELVLVDRWTPSRAMGTARHHDSLRS